jgi:stress response protein SCP2
MVMGKLVRKGNGWDFTALGAPIKARDINDAVDLIQRNFLK